MVTKNHQMVAIANSKISFNFERLKKTSGTERFSFSRIGNQAEAKAISSKKK